MSFGENSNGEISNLNFENTRLGVAVKDGSNLKLSQYYIQNVGLLWRIASQWILTKIFQTWTREIAGIY